MFSHAVLSLHGVLMVFYHLLASRTSGGLCPVYLISPFSLRAGRIILPCLGTEELYQNMRRLGPFLINPV